MLTILLDLRYSKTLLVPFLFSTVFRKHQHAIISTKTQDIDNEDRPIIFMKYTHLR